MSFRERVLLTVQHIPKGIVLTYGDVARLAGHPRAARAVGAIMRTYDSAIMKVPCHRVVAKNGLGGYRWGVAKKTTLLKSEGMVVRNGKVIR